MAAKLTPEQLERYRRDGYIVVEDLVTETELEGLRTRLRDITHGGRSQAGLQIQIEPRVRRGELVVDHPGDGIRKVDSLVQTDDLFRNLGFHEAIVGILEQIFGGPDIKMFRNTILMKPPEVGSQKGMHQDSPYWPIEPMALCSCWFPLDDTTRENGCMAVISGAHRKGALPHVKVTDDFVIDEAHYDPDDMIEVPMKAGGGLFFHSLLPHYTASNRSKAWRRAMALSYMSARSVYTRDGDGPEYLQIQGQSFDNCVR